MLKIPHLYRGIGTCQLKHRTVNFEGGASAERETLELSHTVVILRTPGVIAGVGEVGEDSVQVLVLQTHKCNLGTHGRQRCVNRRTNQSSASGDKEAIIVTSTVVEGCGLKITTT